MPDDLIKGKYDTVLDPIVGSFGSVLAAWLSLKAMQPSTAPELGGRCERFSRAAQMPLTHR